MRFVPTYLCTLLITFLCSCATLAEQPAIPNLDTAEDQTGIAGQVTDNTNASATGAYVYAYRNMRSSLRGPADFEAQVDKSGHYFLDLVEGDYYLVARMRQSGADAGPPKAGDAWALPAKTQRQSIRAKSQLLISLSRGSLNRC